MRCARVIFEDSPNLRHGSHQDVVADEYISPYGVSNLFSGKNLPGI
jgi:hypothetical protein